MAGERLQGDANQGHGAENRQQRRANDRKWQGLTVEVDHQWRPSGAEQAAEQPAEPAGQEMYGVARYPLQ